MALRRETRIAIAFLGFLRSFEILPESWALKLPILTARRFENEAPVFCQNGSNVSGSIARGIANQGGKW